MLHWLVAVSLLSSPLTPPPRTVVIPAKAPTTPYSIDPVPHLVATTGALLTMGMAEALVKPVLLGGFNCPLAADGLACDPSHLWGFDRPVVHWQSQAWRTESDVVATSAIVLAVGAAGYDAFTAGSATPAADAGTDILMIAESLTFSTFFTHVLKFAIRRPRPTMYHPGHYSVENQLSFPSGHVSATASVATAYALTFALRHPDNPWRYAVIGGGLLATGAVGAGRVAGGMHFVSDVIAGACLGAAVGFVLPYLNRTPARLQVSVVPDEAGGERTQVGVEVPY